MITILTAPPGSPGVTTSALGLALAWPKDALLADCDRDPAQPILAGHLRGINPGSSGLTGLLQAHREGRSLDTALLANTLPLTSEEGKRFLPGFQQPASVRLFEHTWPSLGQAFATVGIDVIIDAGRIGNSGLPQGLWQHADAIIVMTKSHLRGLVSLRHHLRTLQDQLSQHSISIPLALGVIGSGKPYSNHEIASQFNLPIWLKIPDDRAAAEVLLDGKTQPRRFFRRDFFSCFKAQAQQLTNRIHGIAASRDELCLT